jgi:hypothetical protein
LLAEKVHIAESCVASGGANPAPKLATLIAGMCAGADSIDDVDVVRSGGMKRLFDGVYAPSTIGTLLRELSFGHARQLESVLRAHLGRLCERVDLLPGADRRAFVDIDSLLRPVHGYAKQGASYGHTKIAGKQVLRKGLSPLVATISTDLAAPVIAAMRLRAGKSGSGKGAGRMVAQAIATARAAGVTGQILVRGDSAYGTHAVVCACRRAGVNFSLVLTKNTGVQAAIDAIPEDAWTPVRYPGAVRDPDTGGWISDAEVAEIGYTAFASTTDGVTARLIVRRVKDARYPDALFTVWRYHPFFTDSTEPLTDADTHPPPPRDHRDRVRRSHRWATGAPAPASSAPTPPGSCVGPSRTLWPAAPPCAARSSQSRHGWPARNDDPSCIYPATGYGHRHGFVSGAAQSAISSPQPPDPARHSHTARPEPQQEKLGRPTAEPGPHRTRTRSTNQPDRTTNHVGRFRPRLVVHA